MANKTIAGAMEIAYYLETIAEQKWLDFLSYDVNGGVFRIGVPTEFSDDVSVGGDLSVGGDSSISGTLSVGGSTSLNDVSVSSSATIGGSATIGENLTVTGKTKTGTFEAGNSGNRNLKVGSDGRAKGRFAITGGASEVNVDGSGGINPTVDLTSGSRSVSLSFNGIKPHPVSGEYMDWVIQGNSDNTFVQNNTFSYGTVTFNNVANFSATSNVSFLNGIKVGTISPQTGGTTVAVNGNGNVTGNLAVQGNSSTYGNLNAFGRIYLKDGFQSRTVEEAQFVIKYVQNHFVTYKFPYDAVARNVTYTIALKEEVAGQFQQAYTDLQNYADEHIASAITDLTEHDATFAGNMTIGGDLTVNGTMTSVDTQTISTHERYIQMMKGNTVAVAGYTGLVWPKYDGTDDFFMGLRGDVEVLGKVTATFNDNGDVIAIEPISLIPLAGRAEEDYLVNGNVPIWQSSTKKFVDGGFNPAQMIEDENQRQTNENTRQGNEVIREASMEEFLRAFPFPITQAEYDNLRAENSAYRVYIYTVTVDDGLETEHLEIRQDVTNDPTSIEGTIKYVFAFDSDSVYAITDDAEIQRMLAVVSEADELLSKQMYVTAEQYAEYSANDWAVFHQLYPNLNPAEVNFYIEDNELYDTLVEAGEQEPIRQEHEVERQAALEAMLRSHPNPITTAEYDHLHDDGYYCNWYYASNEWTMSVDSSSDPTADYSFPYQSDVVYQVTDESAESDLKAWVELNFVNKQTQDTGVTFEITADTDYQVNDVYASYAHQGERISFVISADVVKLAGAVSQTVLLGEFKGLPTLVMNGLYPVTIGGLPYLDNRRIDAFSGGFSSVEIPCNATKDAGNNGVAVYSDMTNLVEGTHYHVRYEVTFLLTPNLYGGN